MTENLRNLCKQLRLAYVADAFEAVEFSSPQEFLTNVFSKEIELREVTKIERNLKKAKFLENKSLESYKWSSAVRLPQTVNKEQLESLDFIRDHQNLVLVGAPGTGKTHLASALGRRAC